MAAMQRTSPHRPGSRQRLIAAASELFSRQGYEASPVKEIARRGAAPMGSFYFHFPEGKEQLGVEALHHGAEGFGLLLQETLEATESLEDALAACASVLAEGLRRSEWLDGCPVATTALESVGRSPALRAAAAEAFTAWHGILQRRLVAAGLSDAAAAQLATSVLALLEGAELLARTHGSAIPLEHAAAGLRSLARSALREED